jgi:hypothetical protein
MTGKNFLDWNDSGRLDRQDLVIGVALDIAEDKKDGAESTGDKNTLHNPNLAQQSSGCCLPLLRKLWVG